MPPSRPSFLDPRHCPKRARISSPLFWNPTRVNSAKSTDVWDATFSRQTQARIIIIIIIIIIITVSVTTPVAAVLVIIIKQSGRGGRRTSTGE